MWTDAERTYLDGQPLGRLATLGPDGPQARPVGFQVNTELGTIDIGGMRLSRTRKWHNVAADARVSFVVDDLASTDPFTPRGVEIRGRAELVTEGAELIRVHPARVISWGLESDPFTLTTRTA